VSTDAAAAEGLTNVESQNGAVRVVSCSAGRAADPKQSLLLPTVDSVRHKFERRVSLARRRCGLRRARELLLGGPHNEGNRSTFRLSRRRGAKFAHEMLPALMDRMIPFRLASRLEAQCSADPCEYVSVQSTPPIFTPGSGAVRSAGSSCAMNFQGRTIIKLLFFFPFPSGVNSRGIKERKQRHFCVYAWAVCGSVWVSCFFLGVSDEPRRKKACHRRARPSICSALRLGWDFPALNALSQG